MQLLNKMCKSLKVDPQIEKTGNNPRVYQAE